MNTPESREGNIIRYAVYLIGYVLVFAVIKLVTRKSPLHIWDLILFGLIAAMVLLFYIYRFNREQRFFARDFKVQSKLSQLKQPMECCLPGVTYILKRFFFQCIWQ